MEEKLFKNFHIIDEPFIINALLKDTPEISKVRSAIGVCCSEIKVRLRKLVYIWEREERNK